MYFKLQIATEVELVPFSTYFCLSISASLSTSVCFRPEWLLAAAVEVEAPPVSLSESDPDVVAASELEERCLCLRCLLCLLPRWRSRSLRSLRLS